MAFDDNNEKTVNPLDTFLDTDFSPLQVSPDGFVPNTQPFENEPIPEATAENFICLRGPCKYYLEQKPLFSAGNTRGTLEKEPILISRKCKVNPGIDVDLTDEVMTDCNMWDPLQEEELIALEARRNRYRLRTKKD